VCMQSSLGKKPWSAQTPLDRAAIMAARCEILLSPGTVISASIRGARFMRNSIGAGSSQKARAPVVHACDSQHRIWHGLVQQCRQIRREFYGTRKIFPVYGSLTSVPGAKPSTSIYLPGEKGLSTRWGLPGTGMPYGKSPFATLPLGAGGGA